MTVLSQSSKETSCCSPLLMENRNEYLTGNHDKCRFRIRGVSLRESHPHGSDLPPCPAVLLSQCFAVRGGDTTESEQPYVPEKVGIFTLEQAHEYNNTWLFAHLNAGQLTSKELCLLFAVLQILAPLW